MSIGASIFLIAVGAILEFAVTVELLMVVGAIGLFISLLWAGRAAPYLEPSRDRGARARRPLRFPLSATREGAG